MRQWLEAFGEKKNIETLELVVWSQVSECWIFHSFAYSTSWYL